MATADESHGAAVSEIATRLNGQWVLNHKASDKMAPFLKEVGVPWLVIKMVDSFTPEWTVALTPAAFRHDVLSGLRTTKNEVAFGEGGPYTLGDGSIVPATVALKDGCVVLVTRTAKGQVTTTYSVATAEGGAAVLTGTMAMTKADGSLLTVRRVFTRK